MNILFATAMAEEAAELTQALEGVTKEEALAAGTFLGATAGVVVTIGIVWFILEVIANWKVFTKAGEAGWKSIIPIYSDYVEFGLCWKGVYGLITSVILSFVNYVYAYVKNPANWLVILMAALGIVALVLSFKQSMKLSKAFGKGVGFGIGLFLLGPIFRLILGFGSARYDDLAEQIQRLQAEKAQRESDGAIRKRNEQALHDLQEFIRSQSNEITEFDEKLVRRLVERITISDETVTVLFKSGQSVEINY